MSCLRGRVKNDIFCAFVRSSGIRCRDQTPKQFWTALLCPTPPRSGLGALECLPKRGRPAVNDCLVMGRAEVWEAPKRVATSDAKGQRSGQRDIQSGLQQVGSPQATAFEAEASIQCRSFSILTVSFPAGQDGQVQGKGIGPTIGQPDQLCLLAHNRSKYVGSDY